MKHQKAMISLVLAVVMVFTLCPTAPQAHAQTSGEIREQINALEEEQQALGEEMAALEQQMSDNLAGMQEIVEQKNLIDQQIFLLNSEIDNINQQLAAYAVLIADKEAELEEAEARLGELNEKNRERIRAMEENGTLSYWSVLFKANSFSDFLDRLNMIEEIAAADQRRLEILREAAEQVDASRAELETERENLQTVRVQLTATQTTLADKRVEADALLLQMQAQGEEYRRYMEESVARENDLYERLRDLKIAYDEAAFLEWLATSQPPTTEATSAPDPSGQNGDPEDPEDPDNEENPDEQSDPGSAGYVGGGDWLYPLPFVAAVNDTFGWRDAHPVYGDARMHYGVDLDAPIGTPVYASRSGLVYYTDYEEGGAGNYVMLEHGNGYRSVYMHLSYYVVSMGDYVTAGQIIGYSGATGGVTGPHLHFGIMVDGEYVNPMPYIT